MPIDKEFFRHIVGQALRETNAVLLCEYLKKRYLLKLGLSDDRFIYERETGISGNVLHYQVMITTYHRTLPLESELVAVCRAFLVGSGDVAHW